MTDTTIDSTARFEGAFEDLLREAIDNDVDVRGSWVVELDDGGHDFEGLIVELDGGREGGTSERDGTQVERDAGTAGSDGDTAPAHGRSETNGGEAFRNDATGSDHTVNES